MDLELSTKYEPLFGLLYGEHPEVDTVVITGGRNSQKSFATGVFTCVAAKDFNHRVLYTRYTLTSAEDSIIPEFSEKIDMLNAHDHFEVTRDRVRGTRNSSKIVFKGIKTSAGNQTAALKSLKDFSMFVLEEAEEAPSFEDWDKVKKSIRVTDVRNLNILLLNPTTATHWIYERFFEESGVQAGWNGVKGNVLYIHSTYLDMPRQFIPDNHWNEYDEYRQAYEAWMKLPVDERDNSPLKRKAKYYRHTLLGGWLEKSEGVIFEDWQLGEFVDTGYTIFGMDWGFSTDPTTLVQVSVDRPNKRLYLKEHCYKTKMLTSDIVQMLAEKVGMTGRIIADSAEPRLITEIADKGFNIHPAVKGQGSVTAGIALLLDWDLVIDPGSENLIKEANNYSWHDKKAKIPVDAWNHLWDPIRYAVGDLLSGKGTPRGNIGQAVRQYSGVSFGRKTGGW